MTRSFFFFNLSLGLLVISLGENFHSPFLLFLCEEDSIRVKSFPLSEGGSYEGKPETTWPTHFESCL